MKNSDPDDPQWEKTRALLREHLTVPPLEHPDFINTRVMQAIEQEERAARPARPPFFLMRLVWAGAALLTAATVLSVFLLPREFGFGDEEDFISHVVNARAEMPQLSVTTFQVPDDRGVVLWLEGSDFIPADRTVR